MSAETKNNASVTSQAPEVSGAEVKYPQCTKKYYLLEENGVVYVPKVAKMNYYNFDDAYCLDKWISGIMSQLAKDAKAIPKLFNVVLTDLGNKTFAIDLKTLPFKFEVDYQTCELVYGGKCPYNLGAKVDLGFVIQFAEQISKWADEVYGAIYNQLKSLAQFFDDIIDNLNPTDIKAMNDICSVLNKIPHLDWFAPSVVARCQSLKEQESGGGEAQQSGGTSGQQSTGQQSGGGSEQSGGGTGGGSTSAGGTSGASSGGATGGSGGTGGTGGTSGKE